MNSNANAVELGVIFAGLEPQAQVVLMDIARRLKAGQEEYGVMDVDSDKRDYLQEAAEEALDFAVYAAMERLKQKHAAAQTEEATMAALKPYVPEWQPYRKL
jgi:hypothetical protein